MTYLLTDVRLIHTFSGNRYSLYENLLILKLDLVGADVEGTCDMPNLIDAVKTMMEGFSYEWFQQACLKSDLEQIKKLLEHLHPTGVLKLLHSRDDAGNTLLHTAASCSTDAIISCLIESVSNGTLLSLLRFKNKRGQTPLHSAAANRQSGDFMLAKMVGIVIGKAALPARLKLRIFYNSCFYLC